MLVGTVSWIRGTRENTFTDVRGGLLGRFTDTAAGESSVAPLSHVDWTRGKKWDGSIRRIGDTWRSWQFDERHFRARFRTVHLFVGSRNRTFFHNCEFLIDRSSSLSIPFASNKIWTTELHPSFNLKQVKIRKHNEQVLVKGKKGSKGLRKEFAECR